MQLNEYENLTPLPDVLKSGDLPEKKVIQLGMDICRELIACEQKNIVHRDIKPENIMVSPPGDFKLGGFELSIPLDQAANAAGAGTELYMAPEVFKGEPYGRDIDIYSLGLVMYWLLNKLCLPFLSASKPLAADEIDMILKYQTLCPLMPQQPTSAEKRKALLRRMGGEAIPEPANGSKALKRIVLKACAYTPKDRYLSAQEMLRELQALAKKDGTFSEIPKAPDNLLDLVPNGKNRILGIHFGASEICVSLYSLFEKKCFTVLRIPAYVAVSELGELLAGTRAIRYKNCHKKAPLYSVYKLMKAGNWKAAYGITYKGIGIYADDLCLALMKELKKRLEETSYGIIQECVLSVSSCSFLCREKLRELMSKAGFFVHRVLNASVACGIFRLLGKTEAQYHVSCTVEGNALEISLFEYEDEILEVLHTTELMFDRKKSEKNIYDLGYEQLKAECQIYEKELQKARIKVYGDDKTRNLFRQQKDLAGDLDEIAAAGAAVQGAKLSGDLLINFLLLDVTPVAFGFEIIGEDNQILHGLEWVIEEQAAIPILHSFEYKKKSGDISDGKEKLRIYSGYANKKCLPEMIGSELQDVFSGFSNNPEKVEITFDLDTSAKLIVRLENPADHESRCVLASKNYPQKPISQKTMRISKKKALAEIWEEMRRFKLETDVMNPFDAALPTAKGLKMIEKQCAQFLKNWGMSYEEKPEKAFEQVEESRMGSLTIIIDDLLQIVDSFEYGIKNISHGRIQSPDRLLMRTYIRFQNLLEKCLDVRPVESEGMLFDANIHFAIAHEENGGLEKGTVVEELQKGYYFGDQILRPGKVKIAN